MLGIALAAAAARAQDTLAVKACDQPATHKIDAAFYGQVTPIPPTDSTAVDQAYMDNVLEAIRESLHPRPLALNEYLVWPGQAVLAAEMNAVFTVTRDGRVRDLALASSSLSTSFDSMILDAIHTADTSGLMPPLPERGPSRVEFVLSVFTSPFLVNASTPLMRRPGHSQPLLVTTLPSWTGPIVAGQPDSGSSPPYPPFALATHLQDSIVIRFAIDENGHGIPASVFVLSGRYRDFAKSVRGWLPTAHYKPARIGTGAVRSIAQQQFNYNISK